MTDTRADHANGEGENPTWTVMVYLAGDNNLTEECIYSLNEMKKADVVGPGLRVFAQYDPKDELLPVQRYEINRKGPDGPLINDEIDSAPFKCESKNARPLQRLSGEQRERRGEGFTGDPAALYNFIAFCLDEARADHYLLIICGHGAGIQRDYLLKDESPDGYLTIHELRQVFDWIQEDYVDQNDDPLVIDIFGMDVCLMSMAEIAYELRKKVKIAIGCESYGPASGWPYREVLTSLKKNIIGPKALKSREGDSGAEVEGDSDPLKVIASGIVNEYLNFYADYSLGGLSVTQSALDVRRVIELKDKIRDFACVLLDGLNSEYQDESLAAPSHGTFTSALILAHWEAQSYNGEFYVDLIDFCDCLSRRYPKVSEDCDRLSSFLKNQFVIATAYNGRVFQYSKGVSIYFPWDMLVPYYGDAIAFPKASEWFYFISRYTQVTRRPPRGVDRQRDRKWWDLNFNTVRMGPDKMGPDKSWIINPIHSMRNPPIVSVTDRCIRDRNGIDERTLAIMRDSADDDNEVSS